MFSVSCSQHSFALQSPPFTWSFVSVVESLSLPSGFWLRSTTATRWSAASATPASTPGPPTAERRSAVTPQTSGPRRSWSKLYSWIVGEETCRVGTLHYGLICFKDDSRIKTFNLYWRSTYVEQSIYSRRQTRSRTGFYCVMKIHVKRLRSLCISGHASQDALSGGFL